jgi:hypothetical protein
MTQSQLDAALRAFCRRRPFRGFLIEFTSGAQHLVSHPDGVRNEGQFYVSRVSAGGFVLFGAQGVSRLLDVPAPPMSESAEPPD